MCCFSGFVEHVANTRIFARMAGGGVQVVAYQMRFAAPEPVAMILPIPVQPGTSERGVRFLSLRGYPDLFKQIERAFPAQGMGGMAGGGMGGVIARSGPPLPVYAVGDFAASFVPSAPDFGRLDPRFRLPKGTWNRLPEYADYGFAVFQLRTKPGARSEVHPMAFAFPTRHPDRLFFPTVHIHDGEVHAREKFDHRLYWQGETDAAEKDQLSGKTAGEMLDIRRAGGLLEPSQPLRRRELHGELPNRDTIVALRA